MLFAKIFPVFLMIFLGLFCRRTQIIKAEGVDGLKTLATSFMLPVLLFHTLATTVYTAATAKIILFMLLEALIAIGVGMLLRRLIPSMGQFLPFIVSSFEGGMLGYPLYIVLCGEDTLSNIATLDIANTIFTFTVFLALLMSTANGNFKVKSMLSNVAHSPVFWGVFLGLILGVSGVFLPFLETGIGRVYLAGEEMLTSAISAVILIVVGYGLSMKPSMLLKCSKAVLARIVIQGGLLLLLMFVLLKSEMTDPKMRIALTLYCFLPPTFVVPVYAKTEEDGQYLSTTLSIYSVVTIAVFTILSFVA